MNPTETPSAIPHSELCTPHFPVHEFKFEGRNYRLFKREPGKDAPWYFKIQTAGKRSTRSLETNVAENAVTKAKAMITASKGERWQEFLQKTSARNQCQVTMEEIFTLYRGYPHRKPSATTRTLNIHALRELLALKYPTTQDKLSLTVLDADLVWSWKQAILAKANEADGAGQGTSDQRHRQLLRSANSRLTQARSLFTNDLQAYYKRHGKIELPNGVEKFLAEPKFPTDECGKTDYWPPSDAIIASTFTSLETLLAPMDSPQLQMQNLNLYKAVWLALGFGLRKSEITLTKKSWFVNLAGIRYCAGDELGKNDRFPRVRAQLGVWEKIGRYLEAGDPGEFVLDGTNGERKEDVFRRCSDWMRALGWTTQKAFHEFRSYAGCQIAMGDRTGPIDIRAAQEFLRHASVTTTENFYMRYLRSQLKEVTLQLPTAQPFIPHILGA